MSEDNANGQSHDPTMAFFTGLVAGAAIGAGLGMLFAPRRGADLRGQMAASATNAGQAISSTVDGWSRRSVEVFERARDIAARAGTAIDRVADEAARTIEATLNVAGDVASEQPRRPETRAAGQA